MRCRTKGAGSVTKGPLADAADLEDMLTIRNAVAEDCGVLGDIYAHNVLTGTATFETTPPDRLEMARRLDAIQGGGLPYLVAELDGEIVGFAYAAPYRERPAYRFTVGNSVYVADHAQGRGAGRGLMRELIAQCTALDYRQMIAVVGADNAASINLHESLGFRRAGTLIGAGYKLGRWVDVALLQRTLGDGNETAPLA